MKKFIYCEHICIVKSEKLIEETHLGMKESIKDNKKLKSFRKQEHIKKVIRSARHFQRHHWKPYEVGIVFWRHWKKKIWTQMTNQTNSNITWLVLHTWIQSCYFSKKDFALKIVLDIFENSIFKYYHFYFSVNLWAAIRNMKKWNMSVKFIFFKITVSIREKKTDAHCPRIKSRSHQIKKEWGCVPAGWESVYHSILKRDIGNSWRQ